MPMHKKEALIPIGRLESITYMAQEGDNRCRHKLGTVNHICVNCNKTIDIKPLKYNSKLRRLLLKEEIIDEMMRL